MRFPTNIQQNLHTSLQTETGSQLLLNNAEMYGQYIVEALTSTTVDVNPDDFQGLRGTQGNIGNNLV